MQINIIYKFSGALVRGSVPCVHLRNISYKRNIYYASQFVSNLCFLIQNDHFKKVFDTDAIL